MPSIFDANNNGNSKYNQSDYTPFGNQADYAFQQGWLPVSTSNGATTYINKYNHAFNNNIPLDNGQKGSLQIVGNRNGLFDVIITDADGKPQQQIMKGQPFSQVDNYFRNASSVINQRVGRLQQGGDNSTILAYKK